MICTFFGHRNCPSTICESLKKVIADLIINKKATQFYIGNNGNFDAIVLRTLEDLKREHPHINYEIVLAYIPIDKNIEKLGNKMPKSSIFVNYM